MTAGFICSYLCLPLLMLATGGLHNLMAYSALQKCAILALIPMLRLQVGRVITQALVAASSLCWQLTIPQKADHLQAMKSHWVQGHKTHLYMWRVRISESPPKPMCKGHMATSDICALMNLLRICMSLYLTQVVAPGNRDQLAHSHALHSNDKIRTASHAGGAW